MSGIFPFAVVTGKAKGPFARGNARKCGEPLGNGRAIARKAHLSERSEEHTSELRSLMRISYAVFCLKKKKTKRTLNREVCSQPHCLSYTEDSAANKQSHTHIMIALMKSHNTCK